MRPRTIRGKLLAGLTVIQVAITLVVLAAVPQRFRADLRAGAMGHAMSVAAMMAEAAADAMVTDDEVRLHASLSTALADPGVLYIAALGPDGTVIQFAGRPGVGEEHLAASDTEWAPDGTTHVTQPIQSPGGREIGALKLGVSHGDLDAVITRARTGILVTQLVLLALILGAASLLARFAVRPIGRMAKIAERIAAGDTAQRMGLTGDGELDVLVHSFNHMVERLGSAQTDLAASNRELEARVQVRTAELRRSEERYRTTFEASHASQLLIDAEDGTIVGANPAACRFYGYSRQRLEGMHVNDLSVTGAHGATELLPRAANGEQEPVRCQHRVGSGEVRQVEAYPSTIEVDGRPLLHSIIHDVTERELAVSGLKDSEARFRSLVEQSLVGIYLIRGDRLSYVNPRFAEIFGYAPEEILGSQGIRSLIHPADWPTVEHAVQRRLSGEVGSLQYDFRGRRKDGTTIRLTSHGARVMVGGGAAILGALVDVTERYDAEEALAQTKQQYRALLDAIPDLAWLKDADARYLACNQAFVAFAGVPREEIIGRRDEDLFPPELVARLHGADSMVLRQGVTVTEEHTLASSSRQPRIHEIVWAPFQDEAGQWAGTAGISRDVTDRRALETQVRNAQRLESIGRLTGGIAHDFNNFLTAIQGFGLLIRDDDAVAGGAVQEAAAEIVEAAGRAASLTRQLLAYSRQQVLDPEVLDVNALVVSTRRMLERLIGEDIAFDVRVRDDVKAIYADAGQVQQVLMNLAVNARDAMPRGGRLLIETRDETVDEERAAVHPAFVPGRYAVLEVSDTGHGMDPETLARVFDPFFTTKSQGEGTGLGLSMVYGIVKQSGGFIWPYSEPDVGTTFRIYMPVTDRVPAPVQPVARPAPVARVGSVKTVLVVEDERAVRALARKALERASFRVLEAETGSDGLLMLEQAGLSIDLMVTDMVMPGLGGKELAAEALQLRPTLPVIFMSGYSRDFLAQRNGVAQEHTVLEKPFTPSQLVAAVTQAVYRG